MTEEQKQHIAELEHTIRMLRPAAKSQRVARRIAWLERRIIYIKKGTV